MADLNTLLSRFLDRLSLYSGGVAGVLHKDLTAVGNVGSGEDTLMTYAVPANTLNVTKHGIRVTAWGKTAANGNSKTVVIKFGGSGDSLLSTGANATNNGAWRFIVDIVRTGSSTQDWSGTVSYGVNGSAATSRTGFGTLTNTDTSAINVFCTGEGTSDNDVVQEGLMVEMLPGA